MALLAPVLALPFPELAPQPATATPTAVNIATKAALRFIAPAAFADLDRIDLDEATGAVLRAWRRERGAIALQLARDNALIFGDHEGRYRHPERFSRLFTETVARCQRDLGEEVVPTIRLHDLRHAHATLLQMSNVASGASFGSLREHALPAAQRAALKRSQRRGASGGTGDLGCQQSVAPGAWMRHLILLQEVTVCCGGGNVQKRNEDRSSIRPIAG